MHHCKMPNCPLGIRFVPQSLAGLCLGVSGEDIGAHPFHLRTKSCSGHRQADGRRAGCGPALLFCGPYMGLHRVLAAVGRHGAGEEHCSAGGCPREARCNHEVWCRRRSWKGIALSEGEVWAGKELRRRNQCREEKNRRREGSLVSYEEPGCCPQCPCSAAAENEGPDSCTDKTARRNLSPQLKYSQALAFLIPSLSPWAMSLCSSQTAHPCPSLTSWPFHKFYFYYF